MRDDMFTWRQVLRTKSVWKVKVLLQGKNISQVGQCYYEVWL